MADEPRMEIQDSDLNPEGDKTPEEKNEIEKELDGLPSEDEDLGGEKKDPSKPDGDKKPDGERKVDRSEVAQKIKWRDRAQKLAQELDELKKNPNPTQQEKKEIDDKEQQAREYIRKMIREETEIISKEKQGAEAKALADFEEAVEAVLEDNTDVSEDRLLDVIEEFEVEPKVALKIIRKWEEEGVGQKPKPKMPAPKRAPSAPVKKPDDANKSMYEVARDVIKDFKETFNK